MKILVSTLASLIITCPAWCGEAMTAELFKKIVATSGDDTPLRPELAPLPFWKNARCEVNMKYETGKVFKEEVAQTAKTVGGKYVVFTIDSKAYNQSMSFIAGYDDAASAIRTWGLFGNILTQSTTVFDAERKISASTSTYAGGFMELSVGSYSDKESTDHTLVYKDGVLFMTRDTKITSSEKPETTKPAAASNQDSDKASK